jgi:hypothetical protein
MVTPFLIRQKNATSLFRREDAAGIYKVAQGRAGPAGLAEECVVRGLVPAGGERLPNFHQ